MITSYELHYAGTAADAGILVKDAVATGTGLITMRMLEKITGLLEH